jgi:hypothetical protein
MWLAAVCLTCASPLLAEAPAKPAPASAAQPFTTAQLAAWLCKALPGNDGRKIAATLFDGKVPGEVDQDSWSGLLREDDRDLIEVTFLGMQLYEDVGAWVLVIELEGDWHGISEEDWVALARRIPGRIEKAEYRGVKICAQDRKDCKHLGGYEAKPGVRFLQIVWGTSDPHPSVWFCRRS